MKSLLWILPTLMFALALTALAPDACAQSASEMFNKIAREMEDDYYNCARGLKGKKARAKAYVEHGKRSAARWREFLAKHGETSESMVFNAKMNLAQALELAKQLDEAKYILKEVVKDATDAIQIKRAAVVTQLVYRSNKAAWDVINDNIKKVEDIDLRAELHLELLKFIVVPKELMGKKRSIQKKRSTFRRTKHREVAAAVAKAYADTDAGKLAALYVEGIDAAAGKPCPDLGLFYDMDNKPTDLKAYKGKVVLIHFWRASSRNKAYMKKLIGMYKEMNPAGLEVIGVNSDYEEDRQRVDDFINDVDIPWRNYHDGEKLYNKIVMVFYVRRFPFNIILGRDGKIASIGKKTMAIEEILADLVNKP